MRPTEVDLRMFGFKEMIGVNTLFNPNLSVFYFDVRSPLTNYTIKIIYKLWKDKEVKVFIAINDGDGVELKYVNKLFFISAAQMGFNFVLTAFNFDSLLQLNYKKSIQHLIDHQLLNYNDLTYHITKKQISFYIRELMEYLTIQLKDLDEKHLDFLIKNQIKEINGFKTNNKNNKTNDKNLALARKKLTYLINVLKHKNPIIAELTDLFE